jgi:hypothetical protein
VYYYINIYVYLVGAYEDLSVRMHGMENLKIRGDGLESF